MEVDEALDVISRALKLESWFEGKTLTVMVEGEDGSTRFVKMRVSSIGNKVAPVDLIGEPE